MLKDMFFHRRPSTKSGTAQHCFSGAWGPKQRLKRLYLFLDTRVRLDYAPASSSILFLVCKGNEYRCFAYALVEDDEEDTDSVCIFVEDAEEDAETIEVLWKTLIGRKKIR